MVMSILESLLLDSTFKLGIGANVQTQLKAIYHLDVLEAVRYGPK